MTTTTTTSLADDLRQLADIIDAHPDLTIYSGGTTLVFAMPGDQTFVERVRAMAKIGRVEKERRDGSEKFSARVKINDTFTLCALDHWDEVACELVQTGTREVERPIMEQVGTELVVEPVMEWKCPESILAATS